MRTAVSSHCREEESLPTLVGGKASVNPPAAIPKITGADLMHFGAALLQHPLPIGPLLSVTRLKDDLVLLSFGQRSAFFGNHTGRSCVKAGLFLYEAALSRCRVLAGQIESKLRHKRPEHFVDELEGPTVGREQTCFAVKGSQAQGRQWHR
jgi:hypothetical protein